MTKQKIEELMQEVESYKQAIQEAKDALAAAETELDEMLEDEFSRQSINHEEEKSMANNPKIVILGAAAVLVSSVKLEDWKLVEKYMPEEMKIVNDEYDTLFQVTVGPGPGSVTKEGVNWGTYVSEEGNATVTVLIDDEVEDKKAAVMEIMGSALIDLMDMEKELPDVIVKIREKMKVMESFIHEV